MVAEEAMRLCYVPGTQAIRPRRVLEALGVADVVVEATRSWGNALGAVGDLPAVEAYLARLEQRAAYERACAD
jgi:glutathione S-transferase